MGSLTIVEDFNEFEDIASGFLSSTIATMKDQFGFQGGKEALHRRFVVRVSGIQSDLGCSKVGRRREFLLCRVELGEIGCLYFQNFREEYV
jgi:hypothetical protein